MKKTLLHFLTSCVTESEAREFSRVIADDSQGLIDKINKFYNAKTNPGVKDKFQNLTKNLFGVPKSPLDLTAPELERFTEVIRDRESQASLRITLKPDFFEDGQLPDPQQIQTKVKDFYLHNRLHFNSYKDLSYDPSNQALSITVRKQIAQKLFDKLGIKPEVSKNLIDGKDLPHKTTKMTKVKVPFEILVPTIGSEKSYDIKQFEKNANQFLKRSGSTVKVYNETTPQDSGFEFNGDLEALHDMFLRSFNNPNFRPLSFDHLGQVDAAMSQITQLATESAKPPPAPGGKG